MYLTSLKHNQNLKLVTLDCKLLRIIASSQLLIVLENLCHEYVHQISNCLFRLLHYIQHSNRAFTRSSTPVYGL